MATLRELIIKISANSASYQSELARAGRMGQDFYRTMQNGGRQAAAAARESERALSDLTSGFATAGRAASAAAAAFATGKIVAVADEWTSVNARLKQASASTEDFAASQRRLMAISQSTGTAFSSNANLFSRAAASMREFGYSSGDVLKITEAVSTGLKLSGASTEEAGSVITQFSQALAQGVLRGEEFNAVNESGDRVIRALAAGMGVARKDLKAMADQGKLTIDKVVPALISQLGTLQSEFASMPQTVGGAMQKVENSFMAWVGGVNNATGATQSFSGGLTGVAGILDSFTHSAVSGALNDVANNMSMITTVAGALVGVGLAKYLGGVVTSATGATAALISAAKAEVALAVAQDKAAASSVAAARADVYRAQQALQRAKSADVQAAQQERVAAAEAKVAAAQARLTTAQASGTATEKVKARTALERAQAALVAAKNTDAQAVAERRLAAAQTGLSNNLANRVSAQSNLNSVTAVGTRLLGGALGLVGGIPGLVMLGAGAWYAMYQNQEQARQSAQEYARTISEVIKATKTMSLPESDDNRVKAVASLAEQNRLVDEQEKKVAAVKRQIDELNKSRGQPGMTSENDANIVKSLGILTDQLAVEENKLNQMRDRSHVIQKALEEIETRRNDLIREQAWRQNEAYYSLLKMTGAHSEFNRLMSLGNTLLSARNSLVRVPMALPQASVSDKDAKALLNKQRQAELAGLTGLAKVNKQVEFDLQDMGRDGPDNSKFAKRWRQAAVDDYNNTQNVAAAQKAKADATREAEKADRDAASQAQRYASKIEDLTIATEVQKVRASEGEKAADLYAAAHQSGIKWTAEQTEEIRKQASELARWTSRADDNVKKQRDQAESLKQLTEAARKFRDEATSATDTAGLSDRERQRFEERQQIERTFDKAGGRNSTEAVKAYNAALTELDNKYRSIAASEADWRNGVSRGYENWLQNTMDIAGTVSQGVTTTMDSALNNVSSMLVRGKADWKEWGLSALEMISKVALQMAVVSAMSKSSGTSGLIGSLIGGITGLIGGGGTSSVMSSTSGTVVTGQSFSVPTPHLNALGSVYDSPSLSAYSNGVYSTPKTFAFAKGAGIFGEAGPEAIMPLTRAADGSLGVRAVNSGVNNVQTASGSPQVYITIEGNGNTSVKTDGGMTEQFGKEIGSYVERRYRELLARDIAPGGAVWNLAKGGR
ncbi:phage tail tape measure protein [Enterobacteriaceae bacterium ENNIH3]|nr:phage tail tape measure protein [Enterobacteriaceae bacterium ENNIH3]AUV07852.1 phage tail tape measure protein [Enterobacteriaceae bacterium ENNIH2]